MPRYIDLDDAIKHLRGACIAKYPLSFSYGIFASAEEISKLPTADVAEVVRCKDCKYFMSDICNHDFAMNLSRADDFCSYGEMRE